MYTSKNFSIVADSGDVTHVTHLVRFRTSETIFSVSLQMVNLNKFCKREILIQLPGEPRENI